MKKGKATNVEVSCIKGMLLDKVSTEGMASQLNRSVGFVKKELATLQKSLERASLFINKTAGGDPGITVMTPAASTKIDENKAKESTIPREASSKPWVHKIRDNG
tara:strand:- start:491 stop:805 length:315 start_codon:yes stop_codon:yes gene_type:complete